MELGLQNGRWESEFDVYLTSCYVPYQNIPICGRADQFGSTSIPTIQLYKTHQIHYYIIIPVTQKVQSQHKPERCDWVYVAAADACYPSSHEIPYGNATIVASHG